MADELSAIMRELPTDGRRLLELRLQGLDIAEIAAELNRTERTIRRRLEQLHELLAKRLAKSSSPGAKAFHHEVDVSGRGGRRPVRATLDFRSFDADGAPPAPASPAPSSAVAAHEPLPRCDYQDFVLQVHLGTGGMGRVYRAWQRSAAREIAVKVLRKNRQTDRAAVERFEAEARTIAALDHPHVTKLYGIGRMPAGGYFFAMQLVEGGDLETHVGRAQAPPAQIARWLRQAASGIAAAHERGVVHCDLKPANLLLDRAGNIVVSDFGFAQVLAAAPQAIGGTLAYAAPELIDPRFGPITTATDIWGLGAVLFSLLTGKPPWPVTDLDVLRARIARNDGPQFDALDTSPLAAACRRALATDSADRFATAAEFASALGRSTPQT
jgi:serine/threonine protein kinase